MATTRKIAVIATGWYFPKHFFRAIAEQKMPDGWSADLFCVSHRDPSFALDERAGWFKDLGFNRRELYDRLLYDQIATVAEIESFGWKYLLEPNLIGDMGNVNQWLEKYDHKEYDKFLFTHDDNFILSDGMFLDILPQEGWLVMSNSNGHAQRRLRTWFGLPKEVEIRGSFEFFTREMMDIIGGKFDMSTVTLSREGATDNPKNLTDLTDWNQTTQPLMRQIRTQNLLPRIHYLSKFYRMSKYCLEGERGFVYKTEISNTKEEERGLDAVEQYYRDHPGEAFL